MPRPLPEENGYLEVVVQPLPSLRFRYKSEAGKSMITGDGSAPCMIVKVHNYTGKAKLFASVVTVPEIAGEKPQPHPHQLAGPHTGHGHYSKEVDISPLDNTIKLEGLYLISIPTKEGAQSLELREQKHIDPFGAGFEHKDRVKNIEKNYVQICFQLAVFIPGQGAQMLKPVCTNPILNTNKKGGLEILKMTPNHGPSRGERRMIILMNGISKKEDVKDVEFIDRENGWKGKGIFKLSRIHEMAGISLLYPKYQPLVFKEKARKVDVVLVSKRGRSEPVPFHYLPDNPPTTSTSERKVNLNRDRPKPMEAENAEGIPQTLENIGSSNKSWSNASNSLSSDGSNQSKLLSSASASLVQATQPSTSTYTQAEDSSSGPSSPLQTETNPINSGSFPAVLAAISLTSSEGSLPSDAANSQRVDSMALGGAAVIQVSTPRLTQPQPSPSFHRVDTIPSQAIAQPTQPTPPAAVKNKPEAVKRSAKAWGIVPVLPTGSPSTTVSTQHLMSQVPPQVKSRVPAATHRGWPALLHKHSQPVLVLSLNQTYPKQEDEEQLNFILKSTEQTNTCSSASQEDMEDSINFDPTEAANNLFRNIPPQALPNVSIFRRPSSEQQTESLQIPDQQLPNQMASGKHLSNQTTNQQLSKTTGQQFSNQITASHCSTTQMQTQQLIANQMGTALQAPNQQGASHQMTHQMQVHQIRANQSEPDPLLVSQLQGNQQLSNQVTASQRVTNQMQADHRLNQQMAGYSGSLLSSDKSILVELTPEQLHQLQNPTQILSVSVSQPQYQPSLAFASALPRQHQVQHTQYLARPTSHLSSQSPSAVHLGSRTSLDSSSNQYGGMSNPKPRPRASVSKPLPAPRIRTHSSSPQTEPNRRLSESAQTYQGDYRDVQQSTPSTASPGEENSQSSQNIASPYNDSSNSILDDLMEVIESDSQQDSQSQQLLSPLEKFNFSST